MGREYSTGIPQPSSKIVKRDKEGFVEFIHGEQEGGKGFR
jgi:hypothetical protein